MDRKVLLWILGGVAFWYVFLRRVPVTGGLNLSAGNNVAQPGYTGYAPGTAPPASGATAYGQTPIFVGGQTATSGAQDAGAVLSGIGNLAGGVFGSGGLGGFIGSVSGGYGDGSY